MLKRVLYACCHDIWVPSSSVIQLWMKRHTIHGNGFWNFCANMSFESPQDFIDRVTRSQRMIHANQPWTDYVFRMFENWSRRSSEHTIQRTDIRDQSASVVTRGRQGSGEHVQVVTLGVHECSCRKWTSFGIPCSHAICTSKSFGLDPTQFVQRWFRINKYVQTYEGRFRLIVDVEYWNAPTFELYHNPNWRERRRRGRYRTTRIQNEMDEPSTRDRQRGNQQLAVQRQNT